MSDLSRVRRLVHIVITIIVVSGSLASATGVAVATGTYEPNDDFDTAKSITAGFSGSTSVGPGDRDFYAIELEEGETIDVTVRNAKDAASEVDVRLYGPTGYIKDDGEDLSTQISDETRYRLGYQAQQTGTYYIDVRGLGVSDDPATNYTMNVEIATNDRFEPNGITEQATEITTGNYQNLSLLSGETDYYAVTLAAGETINVTVRNDKAAAFDPNVELFDSSGNRLDRAEDLGTVVADRTRYRIGYQADTNGTYYIEVRGESSIQSSVGYTMNVEVATNDRFEPNGITEQATEITTGNYQNLSLLSGETDYYAVALAAGETINVTVRNDKAAAFDPNVELFDSSGNRLDRAEDLGTVVADRTRYRIGYQADTNGTYYIEVRGESSIQSSVGYTMNVEVATNDRFEPNGITEQATEITTGNYQNLSLLSGETDYYAVALAAGETINVTVRNDKAAAFDPNVELFDSSGNRLDRAEDLGTVVADRTRYRIGYQADTNGTYYIEVRGESSIQSSVGYTMNVEVATNDRFEPNGITEQATEITTGNYQNLSLLSGETDYYAVTLAAGETINVTVRNDKAAAFDPNVELFDSSGNRLDRAEDLGTVVADRTRYRIGYQADTNGTYYIEVRGESFIQSSVGYTMNVEVATNDRFEPNGVLTKAAPIGPDSYDNLQILSEESDYFAIRVSAGERLNVTAQYSKDYDLNLEVVNSEGQTLATGSDISDEITERAKLRLSYSPDATKKYYIHVKGEFGAGESTIPYTLSVAGGQEPNIAAPAAEYSYSPATPTPNEQIRFNASASTDPDGTIVSYAWDFESDGTTDATGITATHSYATAGEYAVKLTVTDTAGTASTVTESLTVTTRTLDPLTISLTPQSATPGESVTVTVTAPDGGAVTGATITNARLGVESVSDSDGRAVIDIPSTAPGTYAVNVSAGGYAATSRVLNVTDSDSFQSQPTETEPNDNFETANALGEANISAQIVDGESDFYQIDANATDVLSIEVIDISGNGGGGNDDVALRLYDSNRDTLETDTTNRAFDLSLTRKLPETGTYYVEVDGTSSQTTTDYTLQSNQTGSDSAPETSPTVSVSRSPSSSEIGPGETVTVTTEITGASGSVSTSSTYEPSVASATVRSVTVNGASANPTLSEATANGSTVTLGDVGTDATVTITEELTVSEELNVTHQITGEVTAGETTTEVDPVLVTVADIEPQSPVDKYDANNDGEISIIELGQAGQAFASGELTITELGEVGAAFAS